MSEPVDVSKEARALLARGQASCDWGCKDCEKAFNAALNRTLARHTRWLADHFLHKTESWAPGVACELNQIAAKLERGEGV